MLKSCASEIRVDILLLSDSRLRQQTVQEAHGLQQTSELTRRSTSLSRYTHTQPENIKKKCMKVLHYQVEKWPVCLFSVCSEDCCGLSTPCATPNTMSNEYSPSCKQICQPIATGIQPAGHVPWLQRSCSTFSRWRVRDLSHGSVSNI